MQAIRNDTTFFINFLLSNLFFPMFSDTKLLNYFIAHPSFQIYFWGLYIFEYDSYRCNCTNFDKTLKRFSCFFSHKALISPEWFCREAGFCIFAYFNFSFIPHCEFWCIYLLCRNILPQIYNAVNIFFKKIKRTFQKPPKDFLLGRLFTVKYLLLQVLSQNTLHIAVDLLGERSDYFIIFIGIQLDGIYQ